jgi:DUF4097 and DUF4098 domain-containing protein YvlB
MSTEERMAILKMLSEDKISVDEAEKLLKAVGEESSAGTGEKRRERRDRSRREHPKNRELGDLMEEIGEEVRKAVKSVQASEIGRVVSQEVNRAVGSLQRMDVGGMVGDIVEGVKDAVSETVEGAGARNAVEEMEWNLDGAGLARIEAETTSGQIKLAGTDGDKVSVRAYKKVKARTEEDAREFIKEVEVNAVREGDVIRVTNEHPKPIGGVNVEVGYVIECPRRVDVGLRLVNGNVHCRGIEGAVQAQSTNGNVRVAECKGRIEARTRNGNTSASLDELLQEGTFTTSNGNVGVELRVGRAPLTATTTNGNVKLELPTDFSGKLDAKTTNGQVRSDIELTSVEEKKGNLLVGQLGEGGEVEVRLHALNGNVYLKEFEEGEEE